MIRKQGPLRAFSTRSMERSIGVFSKLIKSKRDGGKNASNLIVRFGMHNHINSVLSIDQLTNIIKTRPYSSSSYMNLPQDRDGPQLWEPFNTITLNNSVSIEDVNGEKIIKALIKYIFRSSTVKLKPSDLNGVNITLASRLWLNSTVISSSQYRRFKNETGRGNHHVMFSCSDNR